MRSKQLAPRLAAIPLLLIPLILVVVATQLRKPPQDRSEDIPLPPPEADYYLRGAELSSMDENGKLIYRVHAGDVLHYPDQSISLADVSVNYLNGPWTLTAESGYLPPGEQTLQLTGDVRMHGTLRTGDTVRLQTPSMLIAFADKRIETDAPVQMNSDEVEANATGMRTDLNGQELKLLSDVRVRYDP